MLLIKAILTDKDYLKISVLPGFYSSAFKKELKRYSCNETWCCTNLMSANWQLCYNSKMWLACLYTRAALKVMPPILLYWPTMSEASVGGGTVGVEPFHQHSITFCCCAADGSRGAVWQNGVWHGSDYETKVCQWIPLSGKNCTHWYSLKLAGCLWRQKSGCEYSEVVCGAFQQWWQQCERHAMFWAAVTSAGAEFYEWHPGSCLSLVKMHS